VEWLAVLAVACLLALGTHAGVQRGLHAAAPDAQLLEQLATASPPAPSSPMPPVLITTALPAVDGSSDVAIASQLAAAGIVEVPRGSNRGPGVDVFTDGNAEPWCADFVSWVLRAAGRPFTGGASAGWRLAWTGAVRAWFVARAAWRERLLADPRPGDVVWFDRGHVGIVERVEGTALRTIEGNAADAVTRRVYPHWRLDADIGGFGRPGASAGAG
jgi:hypothetical protein